MLSENNVEFAQLVVSIITLLSLLFAWGSYKVAQSAHRHTRDHEADKEIFQQAKVSLEWAYNTLTEDGRYSPPRPSRLIWLVAARHLLRHEALAGMLKTQHYKLVHAEHVEYWRHRFYLTLDNNQLLTSRYWERDPEDRSSMEIEIRSALVVVCFSNWPEDIADVIDGVDLQAILAKKGALGGRAGMGLKSLLRKRAETSSSSHV